MNEVKVPRYKDVVYYIDSVDGLIKRLRFDDRDNSHLYLFNSRNIFSSVDNALKQRANIRDIGNKPHAVDYSPEYKSSTIK